MSIKTLSEILGHYSVNITLDLYAHVTMELKVDSMDKMTDYIEKTMSECDDEDFEEFD